MKYIEVLKVLLIHAFPFLFLFTKRNLYPLYYQRFKVLLKIVIKNIANFIFKKNLPQNFQKFSAADPITRRMIHEILQQTLDAFQKSDITMYNGFY